MWWQELGDQNLECGTRGLGAVGTGLVAHTRLEMIGSGLQVLDPTADSNVEYVNVSNKIDSTLASYY